jgi:hypothetical protein
MKKSIQLCALGVIAGFFAPWLATTKGSLSGFDYARVAIQVPGGMMNFIYLLLVPVLALLTIVTARGTLGRILAFVTGAYVWGWTGYFLMDLQKAGLPGQELTQMVLGYLGMGGFVTLGCAIALIFLSTFAHREREH